MCIQYTTGRTHGEAPVVYVCMASQCGMVAYVRVHGIGAWKTYGIRAQAGQATVWAMQGQARVPYMKALDFGLLYLHAYVGTACWHAMCACLGGTDWHRACVQTAGMAGT